MKIRRYITNNIYVMWKGTSKELKKLAIKYNAKVEDQKNATVFKFNVNGQKELFALMK
jgi:hypothetical protein